MKKALFVLALTLVFSSCEDKTEKKKYLADAVGAINTLSVVIDNELWNGAVGDSIRAYFASPVDGLPWDEPIFTIKQMPKNVFTGFSRNTRSVLVVSKGEKDGFVMKEDVYARPQKVAYLGGVSENSIMKQLSEKAPKFIKEYRALELKANQTRFKLSPNKETILQDTFGIKMTMPSVYKVVKQEPNFIWIERQIKKGTMGIIAYQMPSGHFSDGDQFMDEIITMRDSIGKKYIPGPDPETDYMITEKAYTPFLFDAEIDGKKGAEMKGMWEMHGYPMAGPFVNYIVNDKENNRLMVVEGFIFAPQTEKRNNMFELEAILKTMKFL